MNRRNFIYSVAGAGVAGIVPTRVFAAVSYACNRNNAFLPNPTIKPCMGYLVNFTGLGLAAPLPADLSVWSPQGTIPVVAVLEQVSWGGGAGEAIQLTGYMSQSNAAFLKALMQVALRTMSVSSIAWSVINFDTVANQWFTQFYPVSPATLSANVGGQASAPNLYVDVDPVKVSGASADLYIYKVIIQIVPIPNQVATLRVASSATQYVAKPWGLTAGSVFPKL